MNTRFGHIDDNIFYKYLDKLVGKIFKLLPLKEEENPTLSVYLDSLVAELIGGKSLVQELQENHDYLSLVMSLESLRYIEDLELFKRKVFECINIVKKIKG